MTFSGFTNSPQTEEVKNCETESFEGFLAQGLLVLNPYYST